MFVADFSINSQPMFIIFRKDYFRITRQNIIKKYSIVQKLDNLTCSNFLITTDLFKPINSAAAIL